MILGSPYKFEPSVTVLMLVYNSRLYLREAIESVLTQTFPDFELLIINDGSTDESLEIIQSYSDSRIRIISNTSNLGLALSRNIGLENARGKYLVIQDSDDVSLPHRLQTQISFMEKHEQLGASGSWVLTIGESESQLWQYPLHPEELWCELLFHNIIANSSAIIRRSVLNIYRLQYDAALRYPVEDYDLWVRLSQHTLLANIPSALVKYRIHHAQASRQADARYAESEKDIYRKQLCKLAIYPTPQELELHRCIGKKCCSENEEYQYLVGEWLLKLKNANHCVRYYPEPVFSDVLSRYRQIICGE